MFTQQNRIVMFFIFLLSIGIVISKPVQSSDQKILFAPPPSQPVLKSLLGKIQSAHIPEEKRSVLIGKWDSGSQEMISVKDLKIVDYHEGLDFRHAALSPRKDKIAFSVHGGVRDMLGVLELETGMVGKLIEVFEGGVGEPVWVPNGQFVAVTLGFASGLREIDIVNVISGDRPLINLILSEFHNKHLETYIPKWSDDSSQLFFSSKHIEGEVESKWVVRVDGTGLTRLE